MATKKNITMKQFNGTDYDTLYPKTIASQIPDVYSKSETYPQSQIDSMINTINTALNGKAQIQIGSYAGTGTYGADNPCSLSFNFIPKVVIINSVDDSPDDSHKSGFNMYLWYDSNYARCIASGNRQGCHVTWSGKQVSWYCQGDAYAQMNELNNTYYYLALN